MSEVMRVFPDIDDPDPCIATGCAMQGDPVAVCRDHRCPHRWQREARIDRKTREEKDAARRKEG